MTPTAGATATSTGNAQSPDGGERGGATSVAMALIWTALLAFVLATVQAGLFYLAGQLALTAAQDGLRAGRTYPAPSTARARTAGEDFLARAAGTTLGSPTVTATLSARRGGPAGRRHRHRPDRDPRHDAAGGQTRGRRRRTPRTMTSPTSPTFPPTPIPATRVPHSSPATTSPAPWPVDRGERGGAPAVEAALLAVLLATVISFVMAGGRLAAAESAADQAARAAARIASIARDPATAGRHAHDVAQSTLAAQHLTCTQLQVTVDTAGFAAAPEQTGLVRAQVSCAVRWSDLALPGAPGTRTVTATFTSPIDRFRERAP